MKKNRVLYLLTIIAIACLHPSGSALAEDPVAIKVRVRLGVDNSSNPQKLLVIQVLDMYEQASEVERIENAILKFVLLDKDENELESIYPKTIDCCIDGDPKDKDESMRPVAFDNVNGNLKLILKCKCQLNAVGVFRNDVKASLLKIRWKDETIDGRKSILPLLWQSMKQPSDPELAIFPSGKPDYAFATKNIKASIQRLEQGSATVPNRKQIFGSLRFMLKRFEVESKK